MITWILLVAELIFVGILLFGVAAIYVPAALILAGVLGVFACELWSRQVARALAQKKRGKR